MNKTSLLPVQTFNRRDFVVTAVTIGGGLALAVRLSAQEGVPIGAQRPVAPRPPAAFLQIAADDTITIVTPAVEMGQGGHTGMPMMIMEELGGDWKHLKVQDAPAAAVYNNPMFGQQSTVGSFSVRGWYGELRRVGASAREMLVAAAATEWKVPPGECVAAQSVITHTPTGRKRSFGSVAKLAAALPVPQQPLLKKVADFKVIGTSPARVDVPAKVDGSAKYGIDMVLPDMLYGAIRQSPTLHGKLKSFDDSAAHGMKGFHSTVELPDGVIVLASSYWYAKSALAKVKVEFEQGALAGLDSAKISAKLHEGFDEPGTVARNEGDADAALKAAASVMEAVYEVPYLAHACMEPMNCTVRVTPEGCDIWCGTQSPQGAQAAAAAALKIPASQVNVHIMYLGGGFGRRGESDYVAQAATAAKAAGKPVKLIWSREEDIQHDFYRPAAAIRFRAALDGDNRLTGLDCRVVTASSPDFGGGPMGPQFYAEGVSSILYQIPNLRVSGVNKNIGVRFGFWRSVNDSHNPYMLEGFLDEIAYRTKQDPYRFRRGLLQHEKGRRQLRVLDLLAEKSGWNQRQPGHFLGIASLEAFGSFIGAVADVSVKDKAIVINRIITVIDCGVAVHPENIRAQLEGGMVYGLSAVLRGEITLADGAVKQSNFHDYPVLLMAEMPVCESYIIASTEAPGGVGEPGTGPIAPALANAIFAATGTRVRSLPLSQHNLQISAARA